MKKISYILFLPLLAFLFSCSRAFDPDVRTGATPMLVDGHPEIRISALGFFDDDGRPVLDVDTDIVYSSLIYHTEEGVYKAGVGVQIQIQAVNEKNDKNAIKNESFTINIEEEDRAIIESNETINVQKRFNVPPGRYEVVVSVTDKSSRKSIRSASNADVFDPAGTEPVLTHIKVMGSSKNRETLPVTTYDIPGRIDSLTFRFFVNRNSSENEMQVNMKLISFESDTLPPRDMSGIQPTPGSIQYRGINYSERSVLEEQNRTLQEESGTILIEYTTARPARGNYRFQVTARSEDISGNEILKARDFSSKSANYPNIESTKEMARPLVYLMNRRQYERMMNITDTDSLKSVIDNFWFSNLGSVDLARRVIELYYTRVEEANRQFSSFKEGWMTDMGMVYVLFGPPYYVERSLDTYVWIYGYDRTDPRRVFRFQRTRMDSDGYPFSHYILERQRHYHSVEYQQRDEWLNGGILHRAL